MKARTPSRVISEAAPDRIDAADSPGVVVDAGAGRRDAGQRSLGELHPGVAAGDRHDVVVQTGLDVRGQLPLR